MGPLAEIALDAGFSVVGSDSSAGLMSNELEKRGVTISHDQSGEFMSAEHAKAPFDWYVYTAALPAHHPELLAARELGIHTGKRDALLAHILAEKNQKLIAIAGTHGKTTTTGMMVWALQKSGVPVSYSIGTTLSWGPSGKFHPESEYFVYECDEFDRNFLQFHPHLSLITSVEWDHPDTYPTENDYFAAFGQFASQSQQLIMWSSDAARIAPPANAWCLQPNEVNDDIQLAGAHNRRNATLVQKGLEWLELADKRVARGGAAPSSSVRDEGADRDGAPAKPVSRGEATGPAGSDLRGNSEGISDDGSGDIQSLLSSFPGTNRRMEKLAENLYSDYGHTPTEIKATLQLARELSGEVVLVYQPHQNIRQHEIYAQYTDEIFAEANAVYWLPTYLSREDPTLEILTPQHLTENLKKDNLHLVNLNDELWTKLTAHRNAGALILCMGAGDIDGWVRKQLG